MVRYWVKYNERGAGLSALPFMETRWFDTKEERRSWIEFREQANPKFEVFGMGDNSEDEAIISAFTKQHFQDTHRPSCEDESLVSRR